MSAEILRVPAFVSYAQKRLQFRDATPEQARKIGFCRNCGNTALCPCCDTECDRCGVKIGEVQRDG